LSEKATNYVEETKKIDSGSPALPTSHHLNTTSKQKNKTQVFDHQQFKYIFLTDSNSLILISNNHEN
jgi:hypothetical protein